MSRLKQLETGIVKQAAEPDIDATNVQAVMSESEQLLTLPEPELHQYAREHGFDTSLPVAQLQEEVFTTTVAQIERQHGGYTPEKVAQLKETFIHQIGTLHFMGLAAQETGVPRKLITSWLKTDLAFAERVYEAQSMMAEKVGVTLLSEGLHKKDTTSLMFLIKQFGDVFQKPIQANFDEMSEAVNPLGDVSKLSLEEQQQLIYLIRKAKNTDSSEILPPQPMVFDESDDDEPVATEQPVLSSEPPVIFNAIPHAEYPIDLPRY